jgi:glycosyltransferase involved in cell wall biosynthesis
MKIIYCGQFTDSSGYGSAARGYLKAIDGHINSHLDNCNLKIHNIAFEGINRLSESSNNIIKKYQFKNESEIDEFIDDDYIAIWHLPAPSLLVHKQMHKNVAPLTEKIMRKAARVINLAAWEYDKVPTEWKKVYQEYNFDAAILPSQWNKEVFFDSTDLMMCYNLPHVIETPKNKSVEPEMGYLKDLNNKFVVFSMSQWGHRKGFDILIKAFCSEFKEQQDVALVLKTYGHYVGDVNPAEEKSQNEKILKEISDLKSSSISDLYKTPTVPIYFVPGILPFENISWLHDKSSIFALTTRGEGFGLTIAEALTHGKPVLVPKVGGHVDYIHPDAAYFVDGHWEPSYGSYLHTCDTHWYEPHIKSVREQLRKAYDLWKEDPNQLEIKGDIGWDWIDQSFFDSNSVAKRFAQIMSAEYDKIKKPSKKPSIKKRVNDLKWELSKAQTLQEKIDLLHNSFEGEECYVLSCGPSLRDHDPEHLKEIFENKLVIAVKQAYDYVPESVDFHLWNCANLPQPRIGGLYYPYLQREPIVLCSSNYDLGARWDASRQRHDVFFKIPMRTEINNEFLTITKKYDDYLLEKNLTRPCGPGIMYETVMYTAVHLGVSKITALGWDLSKENPKDLKDNASVSNDYPHFYENSTKMFSKGDVLPWEVKITCEASDSLNSWLKEKNVHLELASTRSALSDSIPRVTI